MKTKIIKLSKDLYHSTVIILSIIAIMLIVMFISRKEVVVNSSEVMAQPEGSVTRFELSKADKIDKYLASKGSPMEGVGSTCIASEEKWGVPCSWLIAIAGYESGFGTKGYAVGTNNAWGYGIHQGYKYDSWGLGMEAVAQGLKTGYLDRGANDLWTIGQYYCPPNLDNNGPEHSWANGVYAIEQDFFNYML